VQGAILKEDGSPESKLSLSKKILLPLCGGRVKNACPGYQKEIGKKKEGEVNHYFKLLRRGKIGVLTVQH